MSCCRFERARHSHHSWALQVGDSCQSEKSNPATLPLGPCIKEAHPDTISQVDSSLLLHLPPCAFFTPSTYTFYHEMVQISHLFIAVVTAGFVTARPIGDFGTQNAEAAQEAHDAAAAKAAAAEAAAGIDITASIASASSSAAAVAATQTVNPLDPFPLNTHGLTPEQQGQLSGLRAKLAIDTQFGDTAALIQDNADIQNLISLNDGTFGGF
ncbi:hypothetical protein MVEN_01587700 [Mycena venus]|uniref:Uncharacterized protein n=1 Tax=Mycena venus TaxID=2733690 RepID=A0A8H6XSK6_9AGAR|nr:hypothetical protein MVEN_01587700 [Mycena venus]